MTESPQSEQAPDPPYVADETTMLRAYLDRARATARRQCRGLDADRLATTLAPSTMTLGGMLKHLAYVEDWWWGAVVAGRAPSAPFADVDWDADPDWEWRTAADDAPADLRALHAETVARGDAVLDDVAAMDDLAAMRHPRTGEPVSVRWVLLHLIDEYARHAGHADLIRESIDGRTAL